MWALNTLCGHQPNYEQGTLHYITKLDADFSQQTFHPLTHLHTASTSVLKGKKKNTAFMKIFKHLILTSLPGRQGFSFFLFFPYFFSTHFHMRFLNRKKSSVLLIFKKSNTEIIKFNYSLSTFSLRF